MIKRNKILNWFGAGLTLLISGCASLPNFPVFGSKPPVVSQTTRPRPVPVVPEETKNKIHPPPPLAETPFPTPKETNLPSVGKQEQLSNSELKEIESAEPGLPTSAAAGLMGIKFSQERLKWYQEKIKAWQQLNSDLTETMAMAITPVFNDCLNKAVALTAAYREASATPLKAHSSTRLYRLDINFLTSHCEQIRLQAAKHLKAGIKRWQHTAIEEAGSRVRGYLRLGHPQQAVQAYADFINLYGLKAANPDLSKAYELALKRLGRFGEAAALLSETQNSRGIEDEISRADLLMAAGSDQEAKKLYADLSQKFTETLKYQQWAKNQLYIIDKDLNSESFPGYVKLLGAYYQADALKTAGVLKSELAQIQAVGSNAMRTNAAVMAKRMAAINAQWRQKQLDRLDELLTGREFAKAGALLNKLSSLLPADEINNQRQRIKEAAENARQQQIIDQKRQTDNEWRQALDLLDRQKYKAATTAFKGLLNSVYGAEAQKKLRAASNMAAGAMRREAAALFLKAGRTTDPIAVEKMMLQARDLLRQAIAEYPDVEIIDKIKQNLQALEKQLNKFPRR